MREVKPENRLTPEEANTINFPSFSIGLKHIPEAEKWKVGDEYEIALRLRMTRISKEGRDVENSDGSVGSVGFDVIGIDVKREDVIVEKEDEEKSEGSYCLRKKKEEVVEEKKQENKRDNEGSYKER